VADPPVGDSATAIPLEILYFHFSFIKMKKYGLYCLENRFFSMIATPSLIFWIHHWGYDESSEHIYALATAPLFSLMSKYNW
jgi:hypothetical protein